MRKIGKKGSLATKLDLAKAYDRIEWPFLENVLGVIGLSPKLIQLIVWCVMSANLSVLWNGEKVESFKLGRGLLQGGCPVSFVCPMFGGSKLVNSNSYYLEEVESK